MNRDFNQAAGLQDACEFRERTGDQSPGRCQAEGSLDQRGTRLQWITQKSLFAGTRQTDKGIDGRVVELESCLDNSSRSSTFLPETDPDREDRG